MKKHTAFSMIELSIVILVVGILIAGIAQGGRLVRESKMRSAASLTKSSAINGIKGVNMWLETTSDFALNSPTSGFNINDGDRISEWNDINPQAVVRVNVSQTTNNLRPTYVTDGIGGLPSVRFNSDSYLTSLVSAGGAVPLESNTDNFTFVAVWRSTTSTDSQVIFEQNSSTLVQGKRAALLVAGGSTYGFNGESNDAHGAPYAANGLYLSVVTVGQATGASLDLTVKAWTNNNTTTPSYTSVISGGSETENVGTDGFYVGSKGSALGTEMFSGMISEIIIFNRVLLGEEVREVMNYLSEKYNYKIN